MVNNKINRLLDNQHTCPMTEATMLSQQWQYNNITDHYCIQQGFSIIFEWFCWAILIPKGRRVGRGASHQVGRWGGVHSTRQEG